MFLAWHMLWESLSLRDLGLYRPHIEQLLCGNISCQGYQVFRLCSFVLLLWSCCSLSSPPVQEKATQASLFRKWKGNKIWEKLSRNTLKSFYLFLFHVHGVCMYVCTSLVCSAALEAKRGIMFFGVNWNWSQILWVSLWVLGTRSWSSGRASHAPNCWASLQPWKLMLNEYSLKPFFFFCKSLERILIFLKYSVV